MRRTYTSEVAVGSRVFVFDGNRRRYSDTNRSRPIYREHFVEMTVVGETSRSWLVGYHLRDVRKIDKKTRRDIYDAQGVDEACELHDLWPQIHRAWYGAERALTLEQTRQLADWLGVGRTK